MKTSLTLALLLSMTGGVAQAAVLTFDTVNIGNGTGLSQDYGDNISGASDATGSYGLAGGTTPDVTVEYFGRDISLWTTGYDDLTNIIYDEPESSGTWGLILTAAAGFQVTLDSFSLGSFSGTAGQTLAGISVDADGGPVEFSLTDTLIGASNLSSSFAPAVTGSVVTLTLDTTGLGGNSDNIGLDNVAFSQSVAPIPLPAALPLLLAGLGGLGMLRARRG